MNTTEAIKTRKSIRWFDKNRKIPEETIKEIIETAGYTPSWSNSQPWEIYVVTGEKMDILREHWKKELANGLPKDMKRADILGPVYEDWGIAPQCVQNMNRWKDNRTEVLGITTEEHNQVFFHLLANLYNVPACVLLCMKKGLSPYSIYDLGALGQTLMLAAHDKGIGTLSAYGFVIFGDIIHKEIGIPDDLELVLGIGLGYADESHFMNKPNSEHMKLEQYLKIVSN